MDLGIVFLYCLWKWKNGNERRILMGQGEESKKNPEAPVEIQERGEIFFFYRPKVGKEEAHGAEEVQRLYIVLRPESGDRPVEEKQDPAAGKEGSKKKKKKRKETKKKDDDDDAAAHTSKSSSDSAASEGGHGIQKVNIEHEALLRFIVMGRKSLPPPAQKGRPFWGFVEMVTTKIEDVKTALQGEEYDTSTRGHRYMPPARAVGEGVYRILRHNPGRKMHTHLIYKLEFPPEGKCDGDGDGPQQSLNIEREGSFLIQIKNPDQQPGSSQFKGLQTKRKASFPAHLQGEFGHRRFLPADPPDFLDYEGCEFLLIAASDDIEGELGVELTAEAACSDLVETFGETASIAPLLKGTWA